MGSLVAPERFSLGLLGTFGMTGFLLALVGVYGVLSHVVSLRRQEFGLRIALGARTVEIARMVLARGTRVVASGVAIGLVAAIGLARLIESLLYAVSPTGPATYAIVAALVLAVSLLACAVPAYRAAQIDPMKTLRLEQ